MRRVYQVTSLVFLGLAIFVLITGRELKYNTVSGPGPGFFPFWLGILLAVVSVVWFFVVTFREVPSIPKDFFPPPDRAVYIAAVIVALMITAIIIDILGFQLVSFVFLMFLIKGLGRRNTLLSLVLSLMGSVGVYYAFTNWLDVYLPPSSITFLEKLGL